MELLNGGSVNMHPHEPAASTLSSRVQLNSSNGKLSRPVRSRIRTIAQWAAKGQGKHRKEHVGYKVQFAETITEATLKNGEPTVNFITTVVTQPATCSDDAGLPLVEQEQTKLGLEKPSQWYLDGAYISAERPAHTQVEG